MRGFCFVLAFVLIYNKFKIFDFDARINYA